MTTAVPPATDTARTGSPTAKSLLQLGGCILGMVILILIGVKILLEHLAIL